MDRQTYTNSTATNGVNRDRSIGDLIKELRDETTTLLRQEVALAKTEMTEKATKVGRNLAYLAVGGAVAYLGLLFLLWAVTSGIMLALDAAGLDEHAAWVAPLITGVVVAAIGYALIQKAISTLKNKDEIVPQKTVESVQENAQWARQKVM